MSSDEKPAEWLEGRGKRRVEAVDKAYGTLGLDYGKGHLDGLYLAAYEHGLRDAYAFTAQTTQGWFEAATPYDLDMAAQHSRAREQSGG